MSDTNSGEVRKSEEESGKTASPSRKKRAAVKTVAPERTAATGDTVTVEYVGTLPTGRIFDRATPENPFVFTIGAGQVVPAFEAQIQGMRVGETRTFEIPPKEAYGVWRDYLVMTVDRASFPAEERLEVGKRAQVTSEDGTEMVMKVVEVTDTEVKLDGNHPLAGYTLTFTDVTLTAIN